MACWLSARPSTTSRDISPIGFSVEPQALFDYLYHGMGRQRHDRARRMQASPRAPATFASVAPAASLLAPRTPDDLQDFDEAARARELLATLETATVDHRNGGDAAAFLSGGIDSSTVAGCSRAANL